VISIAFVLAFPITRDVGDGDSLFVVTVFTFHFLAIPAILAIFPDPRSSA
jgi:hypothetical protein